MDNIRFENPMASGMLESKDSLDAEPAPRSQSPTSPTGEKKSAKLRKLRSRDGGDIEAALSSGINASLGKLGRKISDEPGRIELPTPDRKLTQEQLRAAFKTVDTQGSDELDKAEVGLAAAELGCTWSDKQLQEVFNVMVDDNNKHGFVDFNEFASFWLGKNWSTQVDVFDDEGDASMRLSNGFGIGAQCDRLGQFLRKKEAALQKRKKKERQVEPESVFVMSADGRASSDRERAELMDKIQQIHENEFHRLEDAFNTHAESRGEAEVWETCARDSFSEAITIEQLGWQKRHSETAKRALIASIETATSTAGGLADDGLGRVQVAQVNWRCFLKEELAHKATAGKDLKRQSSWDSRQGNVSVGSEAQITEAARAFVKASQGELEAVLDGEALPLDTAVEAVILSLTEEVRSRDARISGLINRQSKLADATPRKIKVSGLQGDAAAANGTYCADGLRACWGRPVYLQQFDNQATDKEAHFLYYDQSYFKDENTGISQWTDGMWIIGPSQNSDRCTAYMSEPVRDGAVVSLPHPCCNVGATWKVYDVVKKKWLQGPGDHCPALRVFEVQNDTYQDYIGKSIAEQREMREMISLQVESPGFAAHVRKKLRKYSLLKSDGGGIQRKSYMAQMRKFHAKEVRKMQNTIISNILAAHDDKRLALPADNDFTDNYHLVQTIVHKFLNSVEHKQKQRVLQKRQFLVRMNRPAMSKAFFSWKMISRSNKSNKDVASNMFAEPQTPWNVRHPRSKFTNNWEGVQAFLLVYVAFTVTYRLSFNVEAEGGMMVFDLLVDVYFIMDVIFNFHTAFYDESGDLAGVKDGQEGQPVADLRAMYKNYMTGWASIDLLSVLPTVAMFFISSGEEGEEEMSPSQTKALKAIRLIRLAKLLRLVRAARLFKKYEEHFGPVLSLILMFGVIGLVCHSITCVWFVVGTMPGQSLDAVHDRSVGWLQFVYAFEHCNCYDNETSFVEFYPNKQFDPRFAVALSPEDARYRTEGTFFDPYDKKCHSLDEQALELPIKPMCDPAAKVPDISDYYVNSLFFVFRNPQINNGYLMSTGEMTFAIVTTMIVGSCWGVVAGTFSTIFASNQLASQTYKMRIKQLKEFCRLKDLPHSISEKLEAHYYHLYPDKMMIDEEDVIADLPPQLREELVGTLYGRQLYSVPLFLNLDVDILTDLCTKLVPLPALKGAMIAREGAKGTHMFCIYSGQIKITEKVKDGDEVGRLRHWIEDVHSHANRDIVLFKPSLSQQIDALLTRMRRIARETASSEDASSDSGARKQPATALTQKVATFGSNDSQHMGGNGSDSDLDDDDDELHKRLREASHSASLGSVSLKDLLYDDELIDMCTENDTQLRDLLIEAGRRGRIRYDGLLELTKANPRGPNISAVGGNANESAGTGAEQMCNALKSGEVLLDLIKLLNPRLAKSTLTKKSTVERNIQNFFDIVTDLEGECVPLCAIQQQCIEITVLFQVPFCCSCHGLKTAAMLIPHICRPIQGATRNGVFSRRSTFV